MTPDGTDDDGRTELAIPRPRTSEELDAFLYDTLGIRLPGVSVCPGHSNPRAAFHEAYFGTSPVSVWKASRGFGGKSYALAALSWTEAITLRASVNLLGGSGEQSERVHDYLRTFWLQPRAPSAAQAGDASSRRSRLVWGNTITALAASARAVSGPHPQRLRCDEVDLMDLKILDQALGQPMAKGGVDTQVVLSSAHYEPDGTFTEVINRAKQNGWSLHEWCWRECVAPHGWIDPGEVERQRRIVTAAMWAVQYDLQEPSAEGRAILTEFVEEMFVKPERLDRDGEYLELEAPRVGAQYATGADWARESHDTVIWTWRTDVRPYRLVAYERFTRKPEPYMTARFNERTRRYQGPACHDGTGMGALIKDSIDNAEPFVMVGRPRAELFSDYITAVERGEFTAPRLSKPYRDHKFVKNDDLFSPSGHPPDTFVAAALANRAMLSQQPIRVLFSRSSEQQVADSVRTGMDLAAQFFSGELDVEHVNGNGNGQGPAAGAVAPAGGPHAGDAGGQVADVPQPPDV